MPRSRRFAALILASALVATVALAACSGSGKTVTVLHPAVTATTVDAGDPGQSVGDVRLFETPTTVEGSAATGRMDATLTTTAVNVPSAGEEVRIGVLVFSFANEADQVVVEGSSTYPAAGATIDPDTSTIRPIVGGSGAYAGARGWAESFHLADGTWKHVLHITQ